METTLDRIPEDIRLIRQDERCQTCDRRGAPTADRGVHEGSCWEFVVRSAEVKTRAL